MNVRVRDLGAPGIPTVELDLLVRAIGSLASHRERRVEVVSTTELREGVHRLALDGCAWPSVVAKRLPSQRAQLEHRVTGRWLPAAGLDAFGPPHLATVAEPDGRHVWHVYDDLGAQGLDRSDVDMACVEAAMNRLADLHTAFSDNPFLAEPRFAAGDLGTYFYSRSVRDATRSVERLRPPAVDLTTEQIAVRDAVLARLAELLDAEPERVHLLEKKAGPETLLHGDLTRENVFVLAGPGRPQVRFIDWDHVGVGPAGFDISTHVAYYPAEQRNLVLHLYTTAMAERGLPFPDDVDWDLVVSTFEVGRLANQIIWIALGILEGNGWTLRDLAAWDVALAAAVDGHTPCRGEAGK